MTATRRGFVGLVAIATVAAALSACTAFPATEWSDLTSGSADSNDVLPPDVEGSESVQDIDPSSVRFQWETDGVAYYSALSASDPDTGCLIEVRNETAVTACGQTPPVIYNGDQGTFALGSRAPESEGWEGLTPVLWRES